MFVSNTLGVDVMAANDWPFFRFSIEGFDPETFFVVELAGQEGLSSPYLFDVLLVSKRSDITPSKAINQQATLSIQAGKDQENAYSGQLFGFQYMHSVDGKTLYRARLRPRLHRLSFSKHNQVFLDKNLVKIISRVFKECGLSSYQLELKKHYPTRTFTCQYNESHLNFISHWMESRGLYYFFEQGQNGEQPVITDSLIAHQSIDGGPLFYALPSGLDRPFANAGLYSFICDQKTIPSKVLLKDYNYEHPNISLLVQADVSSQGVGEYYSYGENYLTEQEGEALAKVRAEEFLAKELTYSGESTVPHLRAGRLFDLTRHPNDDFNASYLVTAVSHKGRQTGELTAGLDRFLAQGEAEISYRNAFTAIPATRQFRPDRKTEKARFHGWINAKVDGAGEQEYAVVDDQGRYKIRLPFDLADEPAGHASSWLRFAHPYAGQNYGLHFPLLNSAEVLVAFIDGDPDRPIIAQAAHNTEQTTVINDRNAQVNAIRTAGGNQLVMGDERDKQYMAMWSPYHNSGIAVGSVVPGGGGSLAFATDGEWEELVMGNKNECVVGTENSLVVGTANELHVGQSMEVNGGFNLEANLGLTFDLTKGPYVELGPEHYTIKNEIDKVALNKFTISGGVNHTEEAALSSIRSALWAAAAGNLAMSAGATLTTELFDKEEGALAHHGSDSIYGGSAAAVFTGAGLITTLIAAKKAYSAIRDFEHAAAARASTIELSSDGIEATVNNTIAPTKGLKLQVGTVPINPLTSSSMTLSAADVILSNKDNAQIRMIDGATIYVLVGDNDAGMTVREDDIDISCGNDMGGAKFTADNATVSAGPEGAGELNLNEGSGKLSCGAGSVTVTDGSISLQFGDLEAGPLNITEEGIILMG
ncbi:MAG: hypothetical protein C1943_10815 [Halochromatium sp.]|nr:hypothetical protein [Halochromatium sp.]